MLDDFDPVDRDDDVRDIEMPWVAELKKNLQQGPQKWPQADKIGRQREVGKSVTLPTINRLGA